MQTPGLDGGRPILGFLTPLSGPNGTDLGRRGENGATKLTRPGKLTVCELEHGPVEIVDLPSYKMVIFHSYVNVYQRVSDSM